MSPSVSFRRLVAPFRLPSLVVADFRRLNLKPGCFGGDEVERRSASRTGIIREGLTNWKKDGQYHLHTEGLLLFIPGLSDTGRYAGSRRVGPLYGKISESCLFITYCYYYLLVD